MKYELRFALNEVGSLAERYTSNQSKEGQKAEARIVEMAPMFKRNGCYTKSQFLELCYWKTPRSQQLCVANDEDFIREVTSMAVQAESERVRIEVLTLLNGVGWPTASVLLHFGHRHDYPILDVRALWSLSLPVPNGDFKFAFWWDYVQICRELKEQSGKTMRDLDRALWQYSADKQGPLS